MGKKSKAEKAPKLSKKELKKLAAKAEKAERAAAEKKAAKKRAKNAKAETVTVDEVGQDAEPKKGKKAKHPHIEHLDRVGELSAIVNDDTAKKSARKAAQAELDTLRAEGERLNAERDERREDLATKTNEEIDEAIKARLAKKAADRPGSQERLRALQQSVADSKGIPGPDQVAEQRAKKKAAKVVEDVAAAVIAGDEEGAAAAAAAGVAELAADDAKKSKKGKKAEREAEAALEAAGGSDDDAQSDAVREVVADEEFGKPSESPKRWEDDTNGLGQYKVQRPSDGKIVGYTRVTTYIDALEDKTQLTKWKMRVLLEGVAAAEELAAIGQRSDSPTARIRDLAHRRDVAIAKGRKADRKGKLVPGQLATITDGAWSDFKRAMNDLADELFEIGGGREKAQKGTDLHALVDLYDAEGIDAVGAKLEAEEITPSDLADVEAYARAVNALGLKVVHAEQVIVNDELKVAGRLDRVFLGKLPAIVDPKTGEELRPADTRAKRYVGDLKTGNVEYSPGKIAQQIRAYAEGQAYDPDTHERSSHGANRTTGILIHLPAGAAKATIHLVDLGIGGHGNKIVGEVRAFRNSGKKAIDLKTDLVELAAAAPASDVGSDD